MIVRHFVTAGCQRIFPPNVIPSVLHAYIDKSLWDEFWKAVVRRREMEDLQSRSVVGLRARPVSPLTCDTCVVPLTFVGVLHKKPLVESRCRKCELQYSLDSPWSIHTLPFYTVEMSSQTVMEEARSRCSSRS